MATQVTLNSGSVDSAGSLLLKTNGSTTAVTIDTSQNLGLGVTPSAWSGAKVLEFQNGQSLNSFSSTLYVGGNTYYNGTNYIAKTTAGASLYGVGQGTHIWYNAASVTAGSTQSFTQAMTLDASGNLGVGTTSPITQLHLYKSSGSVALTAQSGGTYAYFANDGTYNYLGSSSGSTGVKFRVSLTSPDNSATIDSSGNLLVGKAAVSDTTVGSQIKPTGVATLTNADSTNGTYGYQMYSTGASAYRFYVGYGGTVYATSTSISAISDATLKENIRNLETGLTEVMALRPRRFDWKNGDAQNVAGFVAQEVEQVLPELVADYVYNKDEEGNDIVKKSLKMGDILPTLVKAIQEQQAIITQLQADVAALKGQA